MARESKSKNASWWSAQIAAWERSGLTQSGFCRAHGLSLSSFSNWRRKLREDGQSKMQAVVVRKQPASPEFIAMEVPMTPLPLVRVSMGSVTVDFETLPPPAWVAELATYGGR